MFDVNNSNLFTILIKWYYNEVDILIALFDTPMKSHDFPGSTVLCFYSTELNAEKNKFVDFLTRKHAEFVNNSNGIFSITGFQGEIEETYVLFKSIDEFNPNLSEGHEYVYDKYMLTIDPKNIKRYEAKKNPPPALPIPTHIKNILIPDKKNSTHLKVIGELRCTCKSKVFYTKTPVENSIVDGSYVKVACCNCYQEYLVFDSHAHGWDGYICRYLPERPSELQIINFRCDDCNSIKFNIKVIISSQGLNDFVSELAEEIKNGKFVKEDWVNAFEWISMDLTCLGCGKEYPQFIDYETM